MSCREVVEFLMEYLSGSLPDAQRRSFEDHLRECGECVRYLASYRQTVRLGKQAFEDEAIAEEMPDELVAAIRAARSGR